MIVDICLELTSSNPIENLTLTFQLSLAPRKFENTKGVVSSCKWKKDRQYNGKKKKDKRINNDLQKTTQKTQH